FLLSCVVKATVPRRSAPSAFHPGWLFRRWAGETVTRPEDPVRLSSCVCGVKGVFEGERCAGTRPLPSVAACDQLLRRPPTRPADGGQGPARPCPAACERR